MSIAKGQDKGILAPFIFNPQTRHCIPYIGQLLPSDSFPFIFLLSAAIFLRPGTQMEPIFQMIVYMQSWFGQPNGLSAWSTSLWPFPSAAAVLLAHGVAWGSVMPPATHGRLHLLC